MVVAVVVAAVTVVAVVLVAVVLAAAARAARAAAAGARTCLAKLRRSLAPSASSTGSIAPSSTSIGSRLLRKSSSVGHGMPQSIHASCRPIISAATMSPS